MSRGKRRVEKLETSLSPKQAILLWLREAHAFNTIEEYVHHLKTQPDSAWPINKLTSQVAEAVKQALKGQPREETNKAVYQFHKDTQTLKGLPQEEINRAVYHAQKDILFSVLPPPASQ